MYDEDYYDDGMWEDYMPKRRGKAGEVIRTVLLAVIALTLIFGVVGLVTVFTGINGFTRKIVNPDNLVSPASYGFRDGQEINGVKISIDGDGVITLNGQVLEEVDLPLGSYTLSAQDYNFSVVADNPLSYASGLTIKGSNDTHIRKIAFKDNYTYRPAKAETVYVYLSLMPSDTFQDYRIAPVIVPGNTIGAYYITQNITL